MNGRSEPGEDLGLCVCVCVCVCVGRGGRGEEGEGGGVRRERGERVRGVHISFMFSHLLLHLLSNNCWHRHALIWHTKVFDIASVQLDMQLSLNTIQGCVYQELFETRVLEREREGERGRERERGGEGREREGERERGGREKGRESEERERERRK